MSIFLIAACAINGCTVSFDFVRTGTGISLYVTMSDSDDSDILADIQALDQALATTSQESVQRPSSSRVQFEDIYTTDVDSEVDNSYDFVKEIQNVDIGSLNAFEINMKLITSLTMLKHKFSAVLQQCEEKIKELDQQLTNCAKGSSETAKLPISCAGMPYFKDKDYFSAPKNSDTKLKEARGELFVLALPRPSRWSSNDREILLRAVHNEAFESILSGIFAEKKLKDKENNQKEIKLVLPRSFEEMIRALDKKEFDWLKISSMDFDGKHSANECRAMWNVYLRPELRKTEWTYAEDKKLLKCAHLYKYQDWDGIAQKLGTSRSAYQCFIRYNTIKKMPSSGRVWTKPEDRHLMRAIKTLRIGDYIPWAEVANYLRHRTKQQIYTRWIYRTAPHLKKGRFTTAETQQLLQAMEKYGTNFRRIANVVMPNRTSAQLINHYETLITKCNGKNLWTIDTDMQLIQLHKKHGNDWSTIAKHFSNKTRTQVRHRFTALLKYVKKGITVESIPRQSVSVSKKVYKKSEYTIISQRSKKALVEKLREKVKRTISTNDIMPRLYETLLLPLSSESHTHEKPYDIKLLARDTKKLYNTLELLNAKLDIPMDDFLDYVQLSGRDKELLVSLIEHISMTSNRAQNCEMIEEFRTRMFGPDTKVNENCRFIPPLPFNGHMKPTRKRRRKDTVIDYDLEDEEADKYLVDVPVDFSLCALTKSFLSSEEDIQFDRFSQLLINDCQKPQKSLQCSKSRRSSRRKKSNAKTSSRNCKQVGRLSGSQGSSSSDDDEEANEKEMPRDIILPNKATLLGCKNLLLWKLLYEYENKFEEDDELSSSKKQTEESETPSAAYQLLRTRLIKLFKFPIGLSNTILEVATPNTIFLTKEEQLLEKLSLKKGKSTDIKRASKNK